MGAPGGSAREYPHGARAFACLRVCVSARVHLHTRMFMHVHTRVRAPVRPRREGGTTHGSGKLQHGPSAPLRLPLAEIPACGGSWAGAGIGAERGAAPAREVGLGEEGGRRAEGGRRLRDVLEFFDRSQRSREGPEDGAVPQGSWSSPGLVERWEGHQEPPPPPSVRLPAARPAGTMLLPRLCWLPLLAGLLPPAPAQKFSALTVSPGPVPASPPAQAPRQSAGDPRGGGASARWHGRGRWVPGWYLVCAPGPDSHRLRWAPGVRPSPGTPTRLEDLLSCGRLLGSYRHG